MKRTLVAVLLAVLLLGTSFARAQDSLIVFAAASLTDAFEAIGTAFEAANPGVEVIFNFASSSDLAAQLAEGAPADVFASANLRQMTVAQDAGRIAGTPRIFIRNRLVVALPADNPANVLTLNDLANSGIRLVIAAPDVPVRDYTDAMLEAMAADAAFGTAYRDAVYANVVSEEPNVRQVAAKIALGEADAGIVYTSDITPDISDVVITIAIPDAFNTIATYPIAQINDSPNPALAHGFIDFVLSNQGQAILTRWNFVRAPATCLRPAQRTVTVPFIGCP